MRISPVPFQLNEDGNVRSSTAAVNFLNDVFYALSTLWQSGTTPPSIASVGQLFYSTTDGLLVCTSEGPPAVWEAAVPSTAPQVFRYEASDTFTWPDGKDFAWVFGQAPGGGGGGGSSSGDRGGGGGGAGEAAVAYPLFRNGNTTETITINAPGTAGTPSVDGGKGGNISIGAKLELEGGYGGERGAGGGDGGKGGGIASAAAALVGVDGPPFGYCGPNRYSGAGGGGGGDNSAVATPGIGGSGPAKSHPAGSPGGNNYGGGGGASAEDGDGGDGGIGSATNTAAAGQAGQGFGSGGGGGGANGTTTGMNGGAGAPGYFEIVVP